MSEEIKTMKLGDEALDKVSGGAGITKWGFPVDDAGNVTYTDKSSQTVKFTKSQWSYLLSQYDHGEKKDSEYYLSTVPAKDLVAILKQNGKY